MKGKTVKGEFSMILDKGERQKLIKALATLHDLEHYKMWKGEDAVKGAIEFLSRVTSLVCPPEELAEGKTDET